MTLLLSYLALSLIATLVFHELGHFFMAKRFGASPEYIQIGVPVVFRFQVKGTPVRLGLLPFAAWVPAVTGLPFRKHALVLLGGCLVNFCIAAIASGLAWTTHSLFLAVLGVTNLLLGLSNLIPVAPCDGWQLAEAWAAHRGRPLSYGFRVTTAAIFYFGLGAIILMR